MSPRSTPGSGGASRRPRHDPGTPVRPRGQGQRVSVVHRTCIACASPAMRGQPVPADAPGMIPECLSGHAATASVYRPYIGRTTGQAATNDPPPATFGQLLASRQARSGRCRSCAARAKTLIPHGFQSLIMDAEAFRFLTARAALSSHPTHLRCSMCPVITSRVRWRLSRPNRDTVLLGRACIAPTCVRARRDRQAMHDRHAEQDSTGSACAAAAETLAGCPLAPWPWPNPPLPVALPAPPNWPGESRSGSNRRKDSSHSMTAIAILRAARGRRKREAA